MDDLDYQEAIAEFWTSRRGHLQFCIKTDSPKYKQDLDAFMDKVQALDIPREHRNDLEDGAANMVGDAILYAHRAGFQDGMMFILQNMAVE